MKRIWWFRLIIRILCYGITGALTGAIIGGSLGATYGTLLYLAMGSQPGAMVGVAFGGVTGLLAFGIGACFSKADLPQVQLIHLVTMSSAYATALVVGGAVPVHLTLRLLYHIGWIPDAETPIFLTVITLSPPFLLMVGLIWGVAHGLKSRWNAQDEVRARQIGKALLWGAGTSLPCLIMVIWRTELLQGVPPEPFLAAAISAAILTPLINCLLVCLPAGTKNVRRIQVTQKAHGWSVALCGAILLGSCLSFFTVAQISDSELNMIAFDFGKPTVVSWLLALPLSMPVISLALSLALLPIFALNKRPGLVPANPDLGVRMLQDDGN